MKKNKELASFCENSFQDQEVKSENNFKIAEIVPEIQNIMSENFPNEFEDYDVILSKTDNSFNDIISEIGDNNESVKQGKSNEVKEEILKTFQKRSQKSFENEAVDKNKSKKLKLDQEVLLWVGNKSKYRKKSQKRKQKSLRNNASILETTLVDVELDRIVMDEPWEPDQDDIDEDISQVSSITSQITGIRISLNRGQGTYSEISYETLCLFKEKVRDNFDIKIPTPGFTQEDFKDFKFPENLEELEVVPSVLADVEYVTPKKGTAQCGVCGIFGLNTYQRTRDHHIRFHTIHYECPIEDCR